MTKYSFVPHKKVRLDEFLRKELPIKIQKPISNSKIRRLIISGSVKVNNKQVRIPFYEVFANSSVDVLVDEQKLFYEKQVDDIKFDLTEKDVLYEDEYLIVVNKPTHFPTEATIVSSRDNLHDAVVRFLFNRQKIEHPNMKNPPYVGIVHRLDRDTTGAILFTKKREVNVKCHQMFQEHKVQKEYIAFCSIGNNIDKKNLSSLKEGQTFTVEFNMDRISTKGQSAKWGRVEDGKGVYSKTDFTILKIYDNKTAKVLCKLYTGRTHQIRVHLSSMGMPIVGDTLYGGIENERIMLHAQKLTFLHPVKQEEICVEVKCGD